MRVFVTSCAGIGLALSLVACTERVQYVPIDLSCERFNPILGTEQDYQVISPGLAQDILIHNRTWKAKCLHQQGAP